MTTKRLVTCLLALLLLNTAAAAVRIKDIARLDGAADNQLLGYGLVVGLAGTGDSDRNLPTLQSVSNLLREFGLQVPVLGVRSRNVAAVMVTATVGSELRPGDKFDVTVSAVGDARSLSGGTLIMAPLLGPDRRTYAVAQGSVSSDSFRFEQDGSLAQKNHPTTGLVSGGGSAQEYISPAVPSRDGAVDLLLKDPDYTTASRVAAAINGGQSGIRATAEEAGRVRLQVGDVSPAGLTRVMSMIESVTIEPDVPARVVVNERTGTVVAGGDVSVSAVTVTQGDIRVAISRRNLVSQPFGVIVRNSPGVETAVVPESRVVVTESEPRAVSLAQGSTVADLVNGLRAIRASSQDVIAVLQGIKRAGALHAELVIQ